MDLRQYARVLRAQAFLIALYVVAATSVAALLAWSRAPTYAASTQFFLSNDLPADLSETYAGSLFSQQRVVSYAQLVDSAPVAEDVIQRLDLPYGIDKLQGQVDATVPPGTVLINVVVEDSSPEGAKAIAEAVEAAFPAYIANLEAPQGGSDPLELSVTRPAQLPSDPIAPQKPVYLLLGALVGIVLGVGSAVVREAATRRIRTGHEAAAVAGVPLLGELVKESRTRRSAVVALTDPSSGRADAYRRVRTNLDAAARGPASSQTSSERRIEWNVSPVAGPESYTFTVSSPLPSEGKTALVANLGVLFAQTGQRVVLIDANLRQPELAELMGLSSSPGLTDLIAGDLPLSDVLQATSTELPLEVIAGGSPGDRAAELLDSPRFETALREAAAYADVVILDAPALLAASEAAELARLVSGVVLITRLAATRVDQLEAGIHVLRTVHAPVLGIVANPSKPMLRRATRIARPAAGAAKIRDEPAPGELPLAAWTRRR
jgi:polysaccharide biosynthesis transport protein